MVATKYPSLRVLLTQATDRDKTFTAFTVDVAFTVIGAVVAVEVALELSVTRSVAT
jgi:hypothetical protein